MGREFIRKPYLLQWKYRIDGDDVWMDTMNNTNHVVYLTLSTPTGSESVPSEDRPELRLRMGREQNNRRFCL